jgi:hypothetical protein
MTRRLLVFIFAVSLVALIGVTVSILSDTAPAEVGDVASVEAVLGRPEASTTSTSPLPSTGALPVETPKPRSLEVPVWSGLLADTGPEETVFPVKLTMASIEVDAPVIATGIDSDSGQMAVPGNVSEVAWYQFGPRPGERGSAVLAAHVDLAGQGPGVFFRLRELAPGDIIEVEFSDGSAQVFRIEARTTYSKEELPLETIFAREGLPVLTLITCGGSFSESSRRYDSNVVAYAVPVQIQEPGPRL